MNSNIEYVIWPWIPFSKCSRKTYIIEAIHSITYVLVLLEIHSPWGIANNALGTTNFSGISTICWKQRKNTLVLVLIPILFTSAQILYISSTDEQDRSEAPFTEAFIQTLLSFVLKCLLGPLDDQHGSSIEAHNVTKYQFNIIISKF